LQIPRALAWSVTPRRRTPDLNPGRAVRRAGLGGALCGLAYAAMARDPVFFFGQAIFLGLAVAPRPGRSPGRAPADVTARRQPPAASGRDRPPGLARAAGSDGRDAGKPG
jgi:hypothetical protein